MFKIFCALSLVASMLLAGGQVKAGTIFKIENFSVRKNGNPIFNDRFDDGFPPPSSPSFIFTSSPPGYFVVGTFDAESESNGKLQLSVDNGADTLTPDGRPARLHSARLLTSTIGGIASNLGPGAAFAVSAVFDLILPGPNSEAFDVRLTDRTQPQGPNDTTNDEVVVRVGRLDSDRPECRDPITQAQVGAAKGEVAVRLISLDFVQDTAVTLDCFKIDLTGNPDQIRLTLAKPNRISNAISGSFTYLNQGNEISTTQFFATDTIFTGGTLPDGTRFPAEDHTRPEFAAFYIPGVPDPNLVAQLTTGSPVSLSQTVSTPSGPFTLEFGYQFATTTGSLTVSLGGVELATIPAPTPLESNFQVASVLVDNISLLNQRGLELQFLLDGPTGSTVLLDNISFPGLVNGDFQTGNLTVWSASTSGNGSVGVTQIASPVALDIKPQSCPNPLNTKSRGVIPVAILGSGNLDVTNIDVNSIRLDRGRSYSLRS